MKLRLEKGLIKFRLSREEMSLFAQNGELFETVILNNAGEELNYILLSDPLTDKVHIHHKSCALQVFVPSRLVDEWIGSDAVGMEETLVFDNDSSVQVVVERDLKPRKYSTRNKATGDVGNA
jgi:hypothetical protein